MKKKRLYEQLEIAILMCEDDVITESTDWQEEYDDKGTWKDTWFK